MSFNPTLPANNSPIISAELRSQFTSLKALIDAQAAQVDIIKLDGTHFTILYRGSPPLEWAVETQGEPDGEWDIETVVAGNEMLVALTGAPYAARIVGRDASHNPVTDVSNVLVLNMPPPELVFDPGTNFTATYAKAGFPDVDGLQVYINTGPIEVTSTPDTVPDDWTLDTPALTDQSDSTNWVQNFFENAQVIVRFHSSTLNYSPWSNIAAYR